MTSFGLKLGLAAATLAGVLVSGSAAFAADADTDWGTVSAYVAVQSDYRFRGVSQNDREPSEEASINWALPEGFYVGTWVAKVDWTGTGICPTCNPSPTVEVDLYGGKHFDLGGTDLNLEAYYYAYPDANPVLLGPKVASYFEGIAQLTHSFGSLTVTATGAVSPEFSLGGGTGGYIGGTASYPLTDWLSLSANVGHQWVDAAPTDYTHFDIGASATWHNFVLDARFNGTDLNTTGCNFYMTANSVPGGHECVGGFVGTLTYNIPNLFN